MKGRLASFLRLIGPEDRLEIHLRDDIQEEVDEMVLGEPVPRRRREEERLLRVPRTELLAHGETNEGVGIGITQETSVKLPLFRQTPSQLDMYDLKPEAPKGVRGEFKPIRTRVPGFDICELLPLQAQITDKLSLKKEMKALLAQAEEADQAEDQTYGRESRGDELPEELARRQTRLKKIREAKAALEAEAREVARAAEAERQQAGKPPSGNDPEQAKPEPKAQYNFTDPESQIMKASNKGWDQCLNAQVVVNEHQIIVAADVTDETNDKRQVRPI